MGFIYDEYSGADGARRFAEIAGDFDFGPHLPRAAFPQDFVASYVAFNSGGEDYDRDHFLATFANGQQVFWLEGLDDPAHIHSQNAILAESIYAEKGATILPPGYYSFGTAMDDDSRWQLMVCLDQTAPEYGQIFLWKRAHDPLGEGDNTHAMGFVAPDLAAFLNGLAPEDAF